MAQILIADDHTIVRMAVRLLLEKAGHVVVGEAGSGIDAIEQARKLRPDLIILDINLPQLDGFSVLQRLVAGDEHFKVLIFTGMQADQYSIRCSRAGACGYVSKEGDLSALLSAVQLVLDGYVLFPVSELSSVTRSASRTSEDELLRGLSSRELEVLRHLARGSRVKDIADALMLSQKTASTYKTRLIAKLQVRNLLELVDLAKRNGV